MAAATVNRVRYAVFGNKRVVLAKITTANASDTYDTKLKIIDSVSIDSSTTAGVGVTFAGGVLTVLTAAGIANLPVIVVGT